MKAKHDVPKYNPQELEKKWQAVWEKEKIYQPDLDNAKHPFFNLMMFPYPSAEGLHVGNMYAFTGTDIYGRFQRMQGKDVLEPIGLDGFGIHSENYALKVGRTPKEHAKISEGNFYRQLHMIGNGFDWSRKVETYDPKYYKWTQWLFIQLFKAGLAYRKKAPVNFCPKDLTVLADEQVIDGKCERCGSIVEKRNLEQWFFKITKYADRLLNNIPGLDWSEKVKIAQKNWIGKKEGIEITHPIVIPTESERRVEGSPQQSLGERDSSTQQSFARNDKNLYVTVFTTRPDTNFGATFIALAPEHELVEKILRFTQDDNIKKQIKEYIQAAKNKSDIERQAEGREKTGVFTGFYAVNQLTGYKMPIWISDFVLIGFGTGALVGVPGHDKRDFEFAQKFGLEIKRVVVGRDGDTSAITNIDQVQEEEGTMINSDFLDGIDIHQATQKIMDVMVEKGYGKRTATYHLRDWLISRQRYWGPPIPLVYCEKCDWQPVPEDQLPILLPDVKDWKPTGSGASPLAQAVDWVNTTCPNCGGEARRETDVSDTFLDSSWYFFRYTSTEKDDVAFDKKRVGKWLPVASYIGGAEHSVLHLLYSRFITMVLKDLGYIDFEEPFAKFRAHGLLIKEGAKMSKSKGNVVIPDEYIKKFGADTLRSYLMFLGPYSQGGDFYDSGIEGMNRFLKRVWFLFQEEKEKGFIQKSTREHLQMMHKTIQKVTAEITELRYNTAIAAIMEWYNFLAKDSASQSAERTMSAEELVVFVKLLAPFAPHMTEEMYQEMQKLQKTESKEKFESVHKQSWPVFAKEYLIADSSVVAVQINGKLRDSLIIETSVIADKELVEKSARESEKVQKHLGQQTVKKVIFIPGKIINFVV